MKNYKNYNLVYKKETMSEEELVAFLSKIGFEDTKLVIDVLIKVGAIKEIGETK